MNIICKKITVAIFMILNVLILESCSTFHTGPLLIGDIPLPFGRMKEGQVLRDYKNRFEVTCPLSDAVVSKGKYGVTFTYMEGVVTYMVCAYDVLPKYANDFTAIENILQGVKLALYEQGIDIETVDKEDIKYRGYGALNFNFVWKSKKGQNVVPRFYITRFVKTENFIYWLEYSVIDVKDDEWLEKHNYQRAEDFFDKVKFEKEF